jgi:two-component system chemotaxis response regulator CheY
MLKDKNPELPVYRRCVSCGRILPHAEWKSTAGQSPCCAAKGAACEEWPSDAALKLLEISHQQYPETTKKVQFIATFLCSAIEMMLESVLLWHIKASPKGGAKEFKSGGGLAGLIKSYEEFSGSSMADRFETLGAGGFISDIHRLMELRSELAEEKGGPASRTSRMAVLSVREWCVKYFVLLNNSLCHRRAAKAAGPKKKSVLVIDDELVTLDFMSRLIKRQGLEYYGAATGTEGLRLFKENGPDCVLLDIALPDMDGLKVLKEMRGMNPSANVHMVTGISGEAIEKEAHKLGTKSYMTKPVDPDRVINIIKNI